MHRAERLVAEGFAAAEGVGDALLGLALAAHGAITGSGGFSPPQNGCGGIKPPLQRPRPAQRLHRTAKTSRTTTAKGPARLAVDTTGQEG